MATNDSHSPSGWIYWKLLLDFIIVRSFYSKKSEFNDKIVKNFFDKKIDLESKKFDISLLKNPYFFDE